MKIKVEVTERNIRLGKNHASNVFNCPLARALKRTLRKRFYSTGWAGFTTTDGYRVEFPLKAKLFQDRLFDGKPVKPFSFTISLPAKTR